MTSKRRRQIMMVDYDNDVLTATTLMLKHLGYRAHSETRSRIALKTFSEHPDKFDLAIIEPVMPELEGIELATRLNHIRPGFPILFYAGYLDRKSEVVIRNAAIGQIIFKPLSLKELKEAIKQSLGSCI